MLLRIVLLIVRTKPACQTLWPKLQPSQTADKYTWDICRKRWKSSYAANHPIPCSSSLTREEQGSRTCSQREWLWFKCLSLLWTMESVLPADVVFFRPFHAHTHPPRMHPLPVIFSLWPFHSSIYFKAFQITTHSFPPHGTCCFLSPLACAEPALHWNCKAPGGAVIPSSVPPAVGWGGESQKNLVGWDQNSWIIGTSKILS